MSEKWNTRRKLAAIGLIAALAACSPAEPTPPPSNGGNTTVNVVVNVGGNPTSSPAPGTPGAGQVVFGVKIGEFGERGSNPANNPREIRVGNVADVTCSPTDANASEIKVGNPSQLIYFKQLGGSGAGSFEPGSNAYNGTITCRTTGVVVLECSLKDLASGAVVTGGNAGTREDSPWTASCVS